MSTITLSLRELHYCKSLPPFFVLSVILPFPEFQDFYGFTVYELLKLHTSANQNVSTLVGRLGQTQQRNARC